MFANITKIVTLFTALSGMLKLIDPIKDLVKQMEATKGTGAEKKEAVLSLIKVGIITVESVFSSVDLPETLILNFASNIIDTIVAIENTIGSFKELKK